MAHGFGIADYVLFALTLLASTLIGVFFACRGKKEGESAQQVLMGGNDMPIVPTALSLLTSFLSGITLLAIPAEVYQRGVLFWFSRIVGTMAGLGMAYAVVIPVFFKYGPISIYSYFEERFGSLLIRRIAAVLYILFMSIYMAVVLYAPSVALNGVTGVPTWALIVSVGLVCIFYTSYGGLKAVVWADSLQAVIMLGGVSTLFFKGAHDAGGLKKSFDLAAEYGRWAVMGNVDPNPLQYMNLWASIFGGIGFWFSLLTFNQIAMQRYLSLPSLEKANKVLAINVPTYLILITLSDLLGVIMFAYFKDCDPFGARAVETKDQIVIYYALEVFHRLPGLPGIFLACLFSGTLSTVSSGINSMAAVLWEDFLVKRYGYLSNARQANLLKLFAAGFGLIAIGLAFAAEPLGGIVKALLSIMGATSGPLVGLFLLGLFFPFANKYGALVGLVASILITAFISGGNVILKPYQFYTLPLFYDDCTNISTVPFSEFYNFTHNQYSPLTGWKSIFGISDILYTTIGFTTVLIFGIPVSLCFRDRNITRHDSIKRSMLSAHRVFGKARYESVKDMHKFYPSLSVDNPNQNDLLLEPLDLGSEPQKMQFD